MSNRYKFMLVACLFLFLGLNIYTLKDGHNWGDDFALYLKHAPAGS